MSPTYVQATDDIQMQSVIIFNTSCARCHEGECSGRMTFRLPKVVSDQHIRHFAGEVSTQTIRQLFELLRYMKEQCGFYPLSIGLARDRVWGADRLARLRSPSGQAYFVPLGLLEPGSYRLRIEGQGVDAGDSMEIINGEFDYFDKKIVNRGNGTIELKFQADARSEYYLRITSRDPLNLRSIAFVGQWGGGPPSFFASLRPFT